MRWSEFAEDEPRLAELGRKRLIDPGVVLVGTIRRDGTPRISPVEPLLWERDLWLSMLLGSYKAADLHRDPRVLVHSIVTGRSGASGEYKVRGLTVEESSRQVQEGYAEQVRHRIGWEPRPR
jgi:Pyridoxamine 5'-phosphate oxidase